MIIPVIKHYFDTYDNRLIVKIKNINISLDDKLSLLIDNKIYNISNQLQVIKIKDRSFQLNIDIPNNFNVISKSIKLLIVKNNSKFIQGKIILNLAYTPNLLSNYSNFWLHRVSKDETLEDIANKYFANRELSYKIYEANIDRIDNNKIRVGQILRIPRIYKE